MARVVFTDAAIDDLRRVGPSVVPRILKKALLLEHDPRAGEPLGGDLTGFRKLVVGDRDWRIVYRVDERDDIEVCEIRAAGARSDTEVYREAGARVAEVEGTEAGPVLVALREAIDRLGRLAGGVKAPEEPLAREPVPDWLAERLVHTAGVAPVEVAALDAEQALEVWTAFVTKPRER